MWTSGTKYLFVSGTICGLSGISPCYASAALQWRHSERDGISNHQPHHCLLNRLLRLRSRKTSKLRATGLCEGNSPVTGEFPAQRASNTENVSILSWWRHQMETFSALLAIFAGNSPVPGEFPTQRPVTRSFDVYFDLRPNKRLSKQSWGWWFETLITHYDVIVMWIHHG